MTDVRKAIDEWKKGASSEHVFNTIADRLDALERAVSAKEPKAEAEQPRCVLCGGKRRELRTTGRQWFWRKNFSLDFVPLEPGLPVCDNHLILSPEFPPPGAVPVGE